MKMEITIKPERRPAVLRFLERTVDSDGVSHVGGIHKESVLVWCASSQKYALCEHPDGTMTCELWDHVKFLDSKEQFDEVCWEEL